MGVRQRRSLTFFPLSLRERVGVRVTSAARSTRRGVSRPVTLTPALSLRERVKEVRERVAQS
jgi:hypothetical protein